MTDITRQMVNGQRFYVLPDGTMLKSVTNIIGNAVNKPGLMYWAANEGARKARTILEPKVGRKLTQELVDSVVLNVSKAHEQTKNTAADFGTMLHEQIANQLAGENEKPKEDSALGRAMQAVWAFLNREGIVPFLIEETVYSKEHGIYGGAIDLVGKRKGKKGLIVLDWKSGKAIYPEAVLQVSAYAAGLAEVTGSPVEEAWIIRAHEVNGELDYGEYCIGGEELKAAFEGFMAASRLDTAIRDIKRDLAAKGIA